MKRMDSFGNIYDDELMHYGKKGMKWGKHVMAQEKYWLTGNGKNLGGQSMNSRMRNDTSGIQWKPTVKPSGGMKVSGRNTTAGSTLRATPSNSYNVNRSANAFNKAIGEGRVRIDTAATKRRASKVVPTSNPAVKGVNTTPQGGFGAKTYTSKKAEMLKRKDTMHLGGIQQPEYGARKATKNNYVAKKMGKTIKKTLSSVKKKPSTLSMGKTLVKGLFKRFF